MRKVLSKDGAAIAFDQSGQGPALILVAGALTTRADWSPLAACLAPHFTVFAYDRRGRGESGDTVPYAVEREIEDIDAQISEAGGSAFVFGHSSGAALALEAAVQLGEKVKKLAMYEAPYNDDREAIAPTLAYDHTAIMGKDGSVPIERAAQVRVPALVMNGGASFPFMYETARTLSKAIPHAQLRILEGQGHGPANEVLVPVLVEFFKG